MTDDEINESTHAAVAAYQAGDRATALRLCQLILATTSIAFKRTRIWQRSQVISLPSRQGPLTFKLMVGIGETPLLARSMQPAHSRHVRVDCQLA